MRLLTGARSLAARAQGSVILLLLHNRAPEPAVSPTRRTRGPRSVDARPRFEALPPRPRRLAREHLRIRRRRGAIDRRRGGRGARCVAIRARAHRRAQRACRRAPDPQRVMLRARPRSGDVACRSGERGRGGGRRERERRGDGLGHCNSARGRRADARDRWIPRRVPVRGRRVAEAGPLLRDGAQALARGGADGGRDAALPTAAAAAEMVAVAGRVRGV